MSNKSRYFGDFWKHRSSINCHQVDRLVGEIIAKYPFHSFGGGAVRARQSTKKKKSRAVNYGTYGLCVCVGAIFSAHHKSMIPSNDD